jgi:flagellar biosynthesis/type III secretory pathway chaperone
MSAGYLAAAQRLADVLAQENTALERLDFSAAVALVTAKEAALAELSKPAVPPQQLAELGQRLAALAAANQTLLQRAIAVQTRIVRIVARAAAPPPAVTRYNGYGGRTRSAASTALALSTKA